MDGYKDVNSTVFNSFVQRVFARGYSLSGNFASFPFQSEPFLSPLIPSDTPSLSPRAATVNQILIILNHFNYIKIYFS